MDTNRNAVIGVFLILTWAVYSRSESVATVSMSIRKENYFAPEFPSPINSVNISEGDYSLDNPLLVTKIEASDQDHEDPEVNGTIIFEIVGASESAKDKFMLQNNGRVYLISPVQASEHFVLVLEAIDQGDPPRRGHCALVVSVLHEASGLSIPSEVYTVRVSADIPPGTHILKIPATDSSGGNLTFSLGSADSSDYFSINPSTGDISTTMTLNKTRSILVVSVTNDIGEKVDTVVDVLLTERIWHSHANCTCNDLLPLLGKNSPPVILSSNYVVPVQEWVPVNTAVFTIPASHADGDKLNFSIESGNDNGDFFIDEEGEVSTNRALNHSLSPEYHLLILATDAEGESANTTLHVNVLPTIPPEVQNLQQDQGQDVILGSGTGGGGALMGSLLIVIISVTTCKIIK